MKKLFIQIPEPCHEDWNKMTKVEQGRYCGSCCKEVVDFTAMSDQQILTYLSTPRGKTCGSFLPDQLNRAITAPQQPSKKWGWGVVFTFLVTLATSCKEKTIGKIRIDVAEPKKQQSSISINAIQKPVEMMPEMGEVISTVTIQGNMLVDPIPPEIDPADSKIAAPTPTEELIECVLNTDSITMVRETETKLTGFAGGLSFVIREEPQPLQQTIIDTIKNIFITPEIKLYPNPAAKGARVNVKLNTPSDYEVMLSDNQSKLIYHSSFNITAKNQVFLLDLPSSISAGMYFVIVTDKRSKKRFTEKLIIQ